MVNRILARRRKKTLAAQQALDAAANVSITPSAALGAAVENGLATLTTEWGGQARHARYYKIIVAMGFDSTAAISLLSPVLRPQLSTDEVQRRIDEQLCIPGRNIHMPMLASLVQRARRSKPVLPWPSCRSRAVAFHLPSGTEKHARIHDDAVRRFA